MNKDILNISNPSVFEGKQARHSDHRVYAQTSRS